MHYQVLCTQVRFCTLHCPFPQSVQWCGYRPLCTTILSSFWFWQVEQTHLSTVAHTYGLYALWVLRCLFRFCLKANFFWHCGHAYEAPSCVCRSLLCRTRLEASVKLWPHTSHSWGLSLACTARRCLCRWCLSVKPFRHSWQTKGRSSVCVRSCLAVLVLDSCS